MRADAVRAGHRVYLAPGKVAKVEDVKPDGKDRVKLKLAPDNGPALWIHLPASARISTRWRKEANW